jgi:hypothetical protein
MPFGQLKRREFISLLGGAAAAANAWPTAAHTQSSSVRPLIGVLSPISAAAARRNVAALRSCVTSVMWKDAT